MKTEKEILEYWEKNKVLDKSFWIGKEPYIFYEGPPTANGHPGLHHVLARAYKDVILRYKSMKGFEVKRKAGWDTHGLPVEIEVEKKLKISGKKQIENIVPGDKRASIIEFNKMCRESVWKYKQEWEDLTQRIGFWLDLKNPYITYENSYIEKLWGIIKKVFDNKLLVKKHKTIPYCPRCETALSSHELAQGYKDANDPSVYVLFKLEDKDEHLLVWTTTPWTLPANMALAVLGSAQYSLYEINGNKIWMATSRAKSVDIEEKPLKNCTGTELVGKKYQPLYPNVDANGNCYKIYNGGDIVTTQEGTGILHMAPGFGEDDYNFGAKNDLPPVVTINDQGEITSESPGKGMFAKLADKEIIKDLENRGLLFKSERIVHTYPFCWRCSSPVLYVARESWFILMSKLRGRLIAENKKINWVPKHLKSGRFGKWLEDTKDWAFSRERYWGTPLPIWQCQTGNDQETRNNNQIIGCGNVEVIGSIDELNEKIKTKSNKLPTNFDLHRPYIDDITWQCQKCQKGSLVREPYVCDVWFDSGSMPFASGEFDDNRYPADYISEAIDQTRGWFYTLLAVAILMDKGTPYKNVVSLNHILDNKGQKMSKSKGNVIDPWEMIDRYSADALRLYLFSVNKPGEDKLFSEKDLAMVHRKNILLLGNIIHFIKSYAEGDKVDIGKLSAKGAVSQPKRLLDRWMNTKVLKLLSDVSDKLEKFEITSASRDIIEFINDLSTWYLRRSRKERSEEFYQTIVYALKMLSIVSSPFIPFISDAIFLEIKSKQEPKSVHLTNIPDAGEFDGEILERMNKIREIVAKALAIRSSKGIKVRQPLNTLTVSIELSDEEKALISDEINVQNIICEPTDKQLNVKLDTVIDDNLKLLGEVREIIRLIQDARKKAGYSFNQIVNTTIETGKDINSIKKYFPQIEKETLTKIISKHGSVDAKVDSGNIKVTVSK